MKKQGTAFLAGVAILVGLAMPLFAQHAALMKIDVPFDFVAENRWMQAGAYTIQPMLDGRLLIRSADGKFATTVLSFRARLKTTATASQVVFHRYGGDYFLAQLWMQGEDTGREVLKGQKESELARKRVPQHLASLATH